VTEQFSNLAESILAIAIDSDDTTVVLTDASKFPATGDFRIVCEEEIMICTARTGNNLTVTRAQEGTSGVGHAIGETVAHVLTAASIRNIPIDHGNLSNVTANQHHNQVHAIDGADHTGSLSHASLTSVTADQHHAQSHTLVSHSTRPHSDLTGVTADQHHAQSHAHTGADGSGTVAHADLTGQTADQHHAQAHTLASHTTRPHSDLTGVTADQHHNQSHSVSDHTTAVNIEDEGVAKGAALTLDFTGTGVTASVAAGEATINVAGATGYTEVQDEGSAVTARNKLNFIGGTVAAADDGSSKTNVTLPDYATTTEIVDIDASEGAGSSATVARGDHNHAHGTGYDGGHTDIIEHGATDHTDITRSFWISAGQLPADTTALAFAGTAPDRIVRLNFVDGSSTGTGFAFSVPGDWASGAMSIQHYVAALTAPGFPAGETFRFETSSLEVADSASVTAASTTTTAVDYTPGTGYAELELYITAAEDMVTPSAKHKVIRVYIRRLGAHANDDFTDTLIYFGSLISYTAEQ
jgi:hypothetical protein